MMTDPNDLDVKKLVADIEKQRRLEEKLDEVRARVVADIEEEDGLASQAASRDKLITLVEKQLSKEYEELSERAEAKGDEKMADVYEFLQEVLPVIVETVRAKR